MFIVFDLELDIGQDYVNLQDRTVPMKEEWLDARGSFVINFDLFIHHSVSLRNRSLAKTN